MNQTIYHHYPIDARLCVAATAYSVQRIHEPGGLQWHRLTTDDRVTALSGGRNASWDNVVTRMRFGEFDTRENIWDSGSNTRHRVFRFFNSRGDTIGAVAVPDRKGLKTFLERFAHTKDGAKEMLRMYHYTFPLPYARFCYRTKRVPVLDVRYHAVTFKCVEKVPVIWFGETCRLTRISLDGHQQHYLSERVLSPVRTEKTPHRLAVDVETNVRGEKRLFSAALVRSYYGWNSNTTFLNANGDVVDVKEGTSDQYEYDLYRWWETHRDPKSFVWQVWERHIRFVRGTTNADEADGYPIKTAILETLPPRVPDDAEGRDFKEQIAMAAFHPKIVDKRLLEYGEDWLERV